MKRCPDCEGDGGYEVVVAATSKWGDPTPGGEWITCGKCDGFVEGDETLIDEDDLDAMTTD